MRYSLIFLLGLWGGLTFGEDKENLIYGEDQRVFKIAKIIKAFQRTDRKFIVEDKIWADTAAKSLCSSSLLSLKLECLLSSAVEFCRDKYRKSEFFDSCKLYMDVLIVNSLSETSFISRREKFDILKRSKSQEFLQQQLLSRYGEVATAYSMSPEFVCGLERVECFAAGIDRFCRENSDRGRLTWQACVGALVRFTIE